MVLRKVVEAVPGFTPQFVMCDYETALFLAVAEVFLDTVISGCLFHINQVSKWPVLGRETLRETNRPRPGGQVGCSRYGLGAPGAPKET